MKFEYFFLDSHHISFKNIQKISLKMLQILSNSFKNIYSNEVINMEQTYFFSLEYCQFSVLENLFIEKNILETLLLYFFQLLNDVLLDFLLALFNKIIKIWKCYLIMENFSNRFCLKEK